MKRNLAGNGDTPSGSRLCKSTLVYVVDDNEDLIELYTAVLRSAGYRVRAFNDRIEALVALETDRIRPQLLVTDCRGGSMSIESFMCCCWTIHPTLRILMASGFHPVDMSLPPFKPDRFLQKPFTPEEFLHEVGATLLSETVA